MARRGRSVARHSLAPYLFLLPNMVIFALFTIWPAINGFNISLYDSGNGRSFRWVGAENYRRILSDAEFWTMAQHTLVFVASFVATTIVLATALALLLDAQSWGKGALRAAYFVPVLISPVVAGLVWSWALERQNGLVNTVLHAAGLGRPGWLLDANLAMICTVVVGLWTHVGFYAMILLAGLQGIEGSVYEASTLDGASTWQQIRMITLPLLRPTTLVVVILATITGFQAFDYVYTLTGGGPVGATKLVVQYIYEKAFESPIQYGLAAAAGVVLFLVVFGATLLNYLAGRRMESV